MKKKVYLNNNILHFKNQIFIQIEIQKKYSFQ